MGRGAGWLGLRVGLLALVAGVFYGAWLDVQVRTLFEGRRWAVPAVLFARALDVYPGVNLTPAEFQRELEASGFTVSKRLERPGTFFRTANEVTLRSRPFQFWDGTEPARKLRVGFNQAGVSAIRDANGTVPLFRVEPAEIGRIYPLHHEDRVLIRLDEAPDTLLSALLVTEDRRFWSHFGVSPRSLLRAAWANLRAGRTVQGGSTLTQQLAKNFFLTPERTLVRKLREAAIALILEARYGKAEILETYLNEVFLGQHGQRAIHGFGLAARFYFGRPLTELRVEEHAMLVALIRGASHYDPRRHPERATARRNLILDLMAEHQKLSVEAAAAAKQRPLGVTAKPGSSGAAHPAFLDLVRRQLRRDYRDDDLRAEGLRIFTTLSPQDQRHAEAALRESLERLDKSKVKDKLQGAVVVTSVDSAEVLALVGGRNPREPGFNRALDAVRPIGSLVKPAVYLAALDGAGGYHLGTPLFDEPVSLGAPDDPWEPQNYDGQTHGVVPLIGALVHSYNLATVHLGMDIGLPRVTQTLVKLGVKRRIPPYPSTLLGSLELSPIEVAQMYQTMAGGGFRIPLRAIREVTDARGVALSRYPLTGQQAVSAESAFMIRAAMEQVVQRGTGRYASSRLPAALRAAGKTGTTDDLRDSWFAGFAGDRLAAVWVGRDDNRPAGLTGSSGALRVWTDLMAALRPHPDDPPRPPGLVLAWVDPEHGLQVDQSCAGAIELPFRLEKMPAAANCLGMELNSAPLPWLTNVPRTGRNPTPVNRPKRTGGQGTLRPEDHEERG